ncbi:hypothetical protein M0802_004039 [Mischocyttarus mexicanus]|nr:hypothetical protein M0802_004039 [Mischocyttarus mexicanus]
MFVFFPGYRGSGSTALPESSLDQIGTGWRQRFFSRLWFASSTSPMSDSRITPSSLAKLMTKRNLGLKEHRGGGGGGGYGGSGGRVGADRKRGWLTGGGREEVNVVGVDWARPTTGAHTVQLTSVYMSKPRFLGGSYHSSVNISKNTGHTVSTVRCRGVQHSTAECTAEFSRVQHIGFAGNQQSLTAHSSPSGRTVDYDDYDYDDDERRRTTTTNDDDDDDDDDDCHLRRRETSERKSSVGKSSSSC